MIKIKPTPNADTRSCDVSNVLKEDVLSSSKEHISHVGLAISFFCSKLIKAAVEHDYDKLVDIDLFYADFKNNFNTTEWWDRHRTMHRHHLNYEDGVPDDVNLIDVLEYISDCVMAGMARNGHVYDVNIEIATLLRAFNNTVEMLKKEVVLGE